MLSLRGRQERGSGLRAMACDDELEEGEACSDDEGVFFDPDVALSYIDEKIQHVLGHFQKDFEGGVCAENLGSKFGGYGSFLPTYQRSPSGVANVSTSRSPYQQSAERMGQNLSTVAVESISLNNGNTAPRSKIGGTTPSSGNLYKKERCSSTNGEKDSVAGSDSLDSSLNGSDQKKLKVRIKVASNYTLPTKNASIYSGLGLDISSSSSMEGSPDDLEGLSPEFSNMPHESPQTILEVMTCFSVPGGFLLSPLRGNILQLTNKVAPLLKKWETHLDEENLSRTYEGDSEPPLPVGHFRGQVAKKIKSGSKKRKSIGTETRKKLDYSSAIMNKEVKIDTQACEVIISDTPNIPSSSGAPATELKGVGHFAKESTKNACISRSYQQNVDVLDEQKDGNDLPTAKAEVMKEATNHMKNGNFDNSGSAYQAKGKVVKTSKVHMGLEERNRTSHKYSPLDGKKESRVKSEKTNEAAIVYFEGINEDRKDWDVGPYDNLKKAPGKETFFGDWDRRENLPIKSQGEKERNMLENRSAQSELRQKEKIRNDNTEEKFDMSWAAKKEIPPSAKHGKFPASGEQQMHMPSTSGIATTTAAPLPAPVVIEENWVCCDMCQKWRLLPYGTNPSMLPKKWKCSMLNWLPGMNKCDISEDKTTNALNALYVTHGSATGASSGGPHTAAAATLPSSTYNISGQLEHSSKRKNAPRGGNDLVESSYPTPSSNRLMSNEQAPIRNKRTIDGEHCPFERDSVSKSADFAVEKQKSKHKKHSSYSGDPTEKSKKHSKFKNRTGIVEDEHRTSKKIKKEDEQYFARDWNHEYDLAGGKVHAGKTLHEKVKNTKSPSEQGDISLRKEKNSSRYDLFENPKRLCDEDIFRKEKKDHPADVEGSDLSENEKMSKERKEIQHNSMDHASKEAKNENSKERKLKIIKSEEMMSKVDSRHVLSSAEARLNNELVADNKFVTGKEASSELWENLPRRQAVDLAEPNKRDVAYLQSSTVATSSSSKISSSRRNKNSQEAKDSPVESVSSSPRRTFNIEKLSHGGMTALNDEQVRNCDENQDAGEPTMRSSLHGSSGSNSKELAQSTHTQVSDVTHLERGLENNPPKASWRKELAANDPCEVRGDNHLCSGDKKGLGTHGPSPHYQQKPFDPMATTFDIESDLIALESKNVAPSHQCKNGSSHFLSNGTKQSDMPSGKDKSQPRISNQDTQKRMAQVARSHTKEGKSEVHSSPLKSDTSKMKAHLRMPNVENGEQHGTGRKAISSPSDAGSPIRKDGSMVAFALKEARDLKHMANHLKSKGQELESTGLYFEAALKFLHVASLLENPTFDSSKPGDAARPMKMYSDTAKLCDFCAHAYEQCKKMAAAALAYKCVEVAYLKAAYYKYPSASKDRQELQAVVQIASGESPSSSASDIDNLNGHGASKALLTKGGNSPQVASSNLLPLAVRNQAHLLRLLAYTNDVNCAFDATRKSEVAIASAASSQDSRKGVDDGLASVRTVLDLNFNNVSELLRLVRLSMEAISS